MRMFDSTGGTSFIDISSNNYLFFKIHHFKQFACAR